MIYEISNSEEMFVCAKRIAEQWEGKGMLALIGQMGAGKTQFSKGFAQGLGYLGDVTSPTFSLLQEYRGGRLPLFHFDWHRIKMDHEILELGWDDYESQGILLVEWADLFPHLWLDHVLEVRIESTQDHRLVSIEHRNVRGRL